MLKELKTIEGETLFPQWEDQAMVALDCLQLEEL